MTLLDTALSAGLKADYVLFDSWFSNPAQVTAIHSKGMDVIAMIKKSSRLKYSYCGEQLNIKEIYSRNKKRRGRSKYLLSVDVMVGKENPIPAKIVCVRNRANRKDWLAFICTDTTLSEEEIIRIYGKRWQIEVFFKTCKSMLNLVGECHSLSYDALTAHVAIVFTRYMLLAMEQRQNEDQRTLGELFFFLVDEMADITFSRSLCILMDAYFTEYESKAKYMMGSSDPESLPLKEVVFNLSQYADEPLGYALGNGYLPLREKLSALYETYRQRGRQWPM